jgi:hypothetical protein
MPGDHGTTTRQIKPTVPSSRNNVGNQQSDLPAKPLRNSNGGAREFGDPRCTLRPVENGEPGGPSADLPDGSERSVAPGRRRFTRRWKITAAVVALVALWAIAAVLVVAVAAEHIHHGEAEVQSARQSLSADGILSGAPSQSLHSADSSFSSAHALLSSPLLWPVDVLPVAGRQLRSVQDLSAAAGQVARTGIDTVGRSQSLLRLPHSAGPDRVAALQQLASLAASTHRSLSGLDLGPDQGLIGPLAHERNTFIGDLTQVQTTLARTSEAASSAATILQGPGTYLLLAGNNAEMRSGSGAFEEAGVITTSDGELHLSSMTPTSSLILPPGAVTVTGDLAARWGWLMPGVDWRNLGLTPQFDVNGSLAAEMWKANTGQSVDGVLAIDVQGLQELLDVTGPVTTDTGQVVSSSNVDQLLLHDQYVGETYSSDSTARVDELSTLASATLHALEDRPFKLHAMADAMSAAAEGRHVLLWSANPKTEAAWSGAGVSGELQPSSLMADMINRGGNKLDQYLSEDVSLRLTTQGSKTDGSLTMTFANHTPPGQSPFIAGPFPGLGTVYGQYVGIATVNLPGYARDITSPSASSVVASGPEGPTILEGATMSILAGATQSITFHFVLPEAHGSMTVVPSARIPPATWHVAGSAGSSTFDDSAPRTITW